MRLYAILGSVCFLLIVPGTVAGLAPWLICHWHVQPPFLGLLTSRVIGAFLIVAGIPPLLDSFARFALQGLGTPAPVLPTKHLVVTGMYRYVRNPMYLGVLAVIFGQGLLFGDVHVLVYGAFCWLAMFLFVIGYEEPVLRRNFGSQYEEFCRRVPRWVPRRAAWRGDQEEPSAKP